MDQRGSSGWGGLLGLRRLGSFDTSIFLELVPAFGGLFEPIEVDEGVLAGLGEGAEDTGEPEGGVFAPVLAGFGDGLGGDETGDGGRRLTRPTLAGRPPATADGALLAERWGLRIGARPQCRLRRLRSR